ncbi:hypothetical protein WJX73_002077 [Symbiochloris irregularis]|uniref:Uncharacterized protein n=1 Tax=Symbiochloris irregularis TaxID=706552 RepID=A0AAW1NPK5_9CHLO
MLRKHTRGTYGSRTRHPATKLPQICHYPSSVPTSWTSISDQPALLTFSSASMRPELSYRSSTANLCCAADNGGQCSRIQTLACTARTALAKADSASNKLPLIRQVRWIAGHTENKQRMQRPGGASKMGVSIGSTGLFSPPLG